MTVGVVLKTKFTLSNSDAFSEYVSYVDRDEATRNSGLRKFSLYNDYMGNPEKTSSLFTEVSDTLSMEEKKKMKNLFQFSQERGSVMWQDVISFDNKWLEKNGVYDDKTKILDEKKLMSVTRETMKEMYKRENLSGSGVWTAAIHTNTDNIHIHIATVEPTPTRTRGKRKPKTLTQMKSKAVNCILDRSKENKKINDIIRENIVKGKKSKQASFNRKSKKSFLEIMKDLPNDRRQWQYGYTTIDPVREKLDRLSQLYVKQYHKKDFQQLMKKLDEETLVMKEAYGEGDKHLYENIKSNKVNELYKRLGNSFLREMKNFDRQTIKQKQLYSQSRLSRKETFKKRTSLNYFMKRTQNTYHHDYMSWKNQRQYEQMMNNIENEK